MTSERQNPGARVTRARIVARLHSDWPWIGILALTSGFQFFRGAPADGVVFLLAAAALVLDVAGLLRFARTAQLPRRTVGFSVGAVVVALLTMLPRYSFADGVIVAGIGLTLIPFAWPDPAARTRESSERAVAADAADADAADADAADPEEAVVDAPTRAVRRAAILWSALGVALCLWELGSFFLGLPSPAAQYAHPALSDLIGPPMDNPIVRAAGAALWLLGGAALLRRGRER